MAEEQPCRVQCSKCPWKVTTDPRDIPNGYDEGKHRALGGTIRSGLESIGGALRVMVCHETDTLPCVGWLAHQLGPGNNIGLRIAASRGQVPTNFRLVGEQHETFEDTLPRPKTRTRRKRSSSPPDEPK